MRQKITTPGEAPPPFRTEILPGHRPNPCSVKPLQLKRPPAAPSAPVQSPPPYCPPFFRGNAVSQTVDCRRRGHVDAGDTPQPGLSGCFLRACFPWLSRCHPSIFSPSRKPDGVSPETQMVCPQAANGSRTHRCRKAPKHSLASGAASGAAASGATHPFFDPISGPMVCPQRLGWCVPGQATAAELTVAEKPQSTPGRQVPPIQFHTHVPGGRGVSPKPSFIFIAMFPGSPCN